MSILQGSVKCINKQQILCEWEQTLLLVEPILANRSQVAEGEQWVKTSLSVNDSKLQWRCLKVTKKDIKCELNADRYIKTSWDFRGANISFCPLNSISCCFGSRWRTTWLDSFSQATDVARYSVCLRMSVGGWTASPPTSAHLGKEQGGGGL